MQKKTFNQIGLSNRAKKVVLGTDNIIIQMKKHKVKLIIISSKTSFNTQKLIQDKALSNNIDIIYINEYDDNTISKALGREKVLVIGIKSNDFKKTILKSIKE